MSPTGILELSEGNYYSPKANASFMSASQFKKFMKCEAAVLAELRGEWKPQTSKEMLIGSYLDAALLGGLEDFKNEQGIELFTKGGELRSEYKHAEILLARCRRDRMFLRYLGGEHQKIVTGDITGVPFRGKIDAYHAERAIVELKTCASFAPVWSETERCKIPFVEAWGYDIQLAIYQYLSGDKSARCFIAGVTKEKEPDLAIMEVPQERLDFCLSVVGESAPRFQKIKNGELPPRRCEKCDYCKNTKVLKRILDYRSV